MPRYFLDLPEDSAPRPWDPHAGARPERADTHYFAGVFREMERTLADHDIDVHLTWNRTRLAAYGDRVVAVLLRDDGGRVPRYAGRVRTVFKCYGTRPSLGTGPIRDPSLTGLAELAQYGVRWLRWLPGGAVDRLARARVGRSVAAADVQTIPLWTFNQVELPVTPIDERSTDLFFAGSVEHATSLRRRVSPKTLSRREMLAATRRLRASNPDLVVDLRLTDSFDASATASPLAYSRGLMDARICLAPRGSSPETFRVLEGLRAGCLVVGPRLPGRPFYEGAPVLTLDRWRDLEQVVLPVLGQPAELRRRHEAALTWWRERCSEAAVGRWMADRLN